LSIVDSVAADDSSYSPYKDTFDFLVDPTLLGFVGVYLFFMLKDTNFLPMLDDFLILSTYFLLPLLVSIFSSYDIPIRKFVTSSCAVFFSITFCQAIYWYLRRYKAEAKFHPENYWAVFFILPYLVFGIGLLVWLILVRIPFWWLIVGIIILGSTAVIITFVCFPTYLKYAWLLGYIVCFIIEFIILAISLSASYYQTRIVMAVLSITILRIGVYFKNEGDDKSILGYVIMMSKPPNQKKRPEDSEKMEKQNTDITIV